jgi:GxxExxY protein
MTDIALIDEITNSIIGSSIHVHRCYGPGLLESAYHGCLAHELVRVGHKVDVNKPIPLEWEEFKTECAYRIDLVVDELVLVEVKCVEKLAYIHKAQMLTYLKLTGCPVGLVINFNVEVLKDGIRRVVNDLRDEHGRRA